MAPLSNRILEGVEAPVFELLPNWRVSQVFRGLQLLSKASSVKLHVLLVTLSAGGLSVAPQKPFCLPQN
jgi:hypothetical protein